MIHDMFLMNNIKANGNAEDNSNQSGISVLVRAC